MKREGEGRGGGRESERGREGWGGGGEAGREGEREGEGQTNKGAPGQQGKHGSRLRAQPKDTSNLRSSRGSIQAAKGNGLLLFVMHGYSRTWNSSLDAAHQGIIDRRHSKTRCKTSCQLSPLPCPIEKLSHARRCITCVHKQ